MSTFIEEPKYSWEHSLHKYNWNQLLSLEKFPQVKVGKKSRTQNNENNIKYIKYIIIVS